MSVPDRSIDPRLLSAAKKEFLQKGYKTASLAADTIRDMEEYTAEIEKEDLSKYSDQELYDSLSMTPESILKWMKILDDHRDGFVLLVRCASGTRFENFHHDWAVIMNGMNYKWYLEARRRGMTDRELSREEMHVLTSAVWSLYFEPFYHDFSWEQIEEHAVLFHDFVNLPKALGLRNPKGA